MSGIKEVRGAASVGCGSEPPTPLRRFRVAHLIESSRMYGRQLLRGIAAFASEHRNWILFHEEHSLGEEIPLRLRRWRPDGIIAQLAGAKMIRQIRRMKVPVVDLYGEEKIPGVSGILPDADAMIQMAISHFLERGFRNFAYCGFTNVLFSEIREACFVERLAKQGYQAHVFRYPPLAKPKGLAAVEAHARQYSAQLAKWLRNLPKPVGLLACDDTRGQQILFVCNEAGIAVPDEVGVLGIDNDDVQCELSTPSLSSIDPNVQAIGYKAASLLHQLLNGQPTCSDCSDKLLVSPLRVVARHSTDVLAFADPEVAEVVRFVREHAFDGMSLEAMTAHLKISRSTIERWLHRSLGRSFVEEIMRVRINRVAELLLTTNLKVEKIAHLSGFPHVASMSRMFKKVQGLSPGQYRLKVNTVS